MLYSTPLSFASFLDMTLLNSRTIKSSNQCIPSFLIKDCIGKKNGHLSVLNNIRQHHNCLDIFLPHHSPEIFNCILSRTQKQIVSLRILFYSDHSLNQIIDHMLFFFCNWKLFLKYTYHFISPNTYSKSFHLTSAINIPCAAINLAFSCLS